jgi:hypothetical protein
LLPVAVIAISSFVFSHCLLILAVGSGWDCSCRQLQIHCCSHSKCIVDVVTIAAEDNWDKVDKVGELLPLSSLCSLKVDWRAEMKQGGP